MRADCRDCNYGYLAVRKLLVFFYAFFIGIVMLLCGRYTVIKKKNFAKKRIGFKIAILLIIFVSAMRFNIGYDWLAYLSYVYPPDNPLWVSNYEPLSTIIYLLARALRRPWVMFALYALLTYFFIGITVYTFSIDIYESLMIYMCLFYLGGLSTIRQELAVSIVFYGYKYIKERKAMNYLLLCLVAMGFHRTAVVAIFLYPLYAMKFRFVVITCLLVAIFFDLLLPALCESVFHLSVRYLDYDFAKSSGRFLRLVYVCLILYALILSRYTKRTKGQDVAGISNICIFGVSIPFMLGSMTGGRLAEYFLIYLTILVPQCTRILKPKTRALCMIPLYISFFGYLYVAAPAYIPFKFYFLENLEGLL